MHKNVLLFPPISPPKHTAPAAPEDNFVRLNVVDDLYAYMGILEGAVLVSQSGKVTEGYLHYVELGDYGFLAGLTDCTESTVHITPLDRETPPGVYSRAELQFIGLLVVYYPRGLTGAVWTLSAKRSLSEARPFFEAVAN